jgi:hypothetical protein
MSMPEMFENLPEYTPYTNEELTELLSGQVPIDAGAEEPDIYMTSQIEGEDNVSS